MEFVMDTFVKYALANGAQIEPLIIDSKLTNGTGLFNPSIYVDGDRLLLNIRHCQYTFFLAEYGIHEHPWGPLLYMNPENDISLTTVNYMGELDDNLQIKYINRVDTSKFDVKPLWEFVGLEDARIVRWDGKLYITGVRRDTTTHGEGRMEMSEIEMTETSCKEISRWRIPAPPPNTAYCEKNWMPFIDVPWQFWKWSYPVEIVKVDPVQRTTETIFQGQIPPFHKDLRGSGQVIPFEDGYLTLTHEIDLFRSEQDRKNAVYTHRFVHWSKNFEPLAWSDDFSFMGTKVEFACGLAEWKGDLLMTFGFQDNAAYILRCSKKVVKDYMNA
jgi:hypothetical protein